MMYNLIEKDFRVIKWYFVMFMANWVLYSFALFRFGLFIPGCSVFTILLPMIFLLVDTAHKSESMICSMPVKRNEIIRARYLSSLIILTFGLLITLLMGFTIENLTDSKDALIGSLFTISGALGFVLKAMVMTAFILPFYYKYGIATGFPVFMAFLLAVILILLGIEYVISIMRGLDMFMMPIFSGIITVIAEFSNEIGMIPFRVLSLVIIVSLVLLSMKLSEKYYNKRDL
ncbi:MAG: ABC-2 transporter permease [bacterium]|nr:ABC-2 transporter permease [bacterium]